MIKPLREEQADMKARWSDPLYRWTHDSALRKRIEGTTKPKEFHGKEKDETQSNC